MVAFAHCKQRPRRAHLWTLDAFGNPQPEDDVLRWASWYETFDRQLATDEINGRLISTIFTGMDQGYGNGPPILWETMVFDGSEEYQTRYASREAAIQGHQEACRLVREGKL